MRKFYLFIIVAFLAFATTGYAQRTTSIGSAEEFASSAGVVRSARIDDAHFVVFYKENSTSSANDLYARVGEVDSENQTITWGTAALVESDTCLRSTITELNETQVVVAYEREVNGNDTGIARVLTIDTATDLITVGNAYVFHEAAIDAAFSHTPISMVKLTDSKFAMCFADDATDNGQVVIGNVSGSALTFGAAQEWTTGDVHNFWIDTLSSTKIIISFEDDGSSGDAGKAIIGNISGNSITYGSDYSFYDNGSGASVVHTAVKSISATQAIIAYTRDALNEGYAVVATISGTVITYGGHYAMPNEVSSAGPRDITIGFAYGAATGDNEVTIAYNTGFSDTSFVLVAKADGTALSFTSDEFLLSEADDSWILTLNENTLVVCYVDDNNGDEGQSKVISLSPEQSDPFASEIPGAGYALEFDGTNDFIGFGKVNLFSGLTYTAWIKTSSTDSVSDYEGNPALTVIGDHTNNVWNGFGVQSGKLVYKHYTGSWDSIVGSISVNDGNWHHIAVTHNQSSGLVRLYVDGIVDETGNLSYGGGGGEVKVGFDRIGGGYVDAAATQDFFDGGIDEITAWSTDLDSNLIREWMTQKINGSHDSISALAAYFKCDEGTGVVLEDIAGGQNGAMTNSPAWAVSGAALGDESVVSYNGEESQLVDTLSNGNEITISGFGDAVGIHLYTVTDTAELSTYSSLIASADSTEYFGVFMVDGSSYDVTIDYSANTAINGQTNEQQARGIKRSGGDDATWEMASGELRTDVSANTISILNQTGTEYVTGFTNAGYPVRAGSGFALDFDGVDDRVITSVNLNPSTTSYTVECWINPDSIPTGQARGIIQQAGGSGQGRTQILINTAGQLGSYLGGSGMNSNTIVNPGEWMHVAFSYDGNIRRIYVNGRLENSAATTAESADGAWRFGYTTVGQAFDGKIDEVRIWNAALDSNQIRQWMTKKVSASHDSIASLVAYYRFDEGADTLLQDLVGGNDGVLTNMDASADWVRSGAALGDESKFTYGGAIIVDTMANGNEITLSDFADADGIHLYTVNDTAVGSSYPNTLASADSTEYFGVFKVGGTSYDVTIDYSSNTAINGQSIERQARGIKRSGGDDDTWKVTTGEFRTDVANNTISILNQTGTEYVTGFANTSYPDRAGSGYALDFDGVDDFIDLTNNTSLKPEIEMTAQMWVSASNWSTLGNTSLISNKEVGGFNIGTTDSVLYVGIRLNGSYTFVAKDLSVLKSGWNHVATTYTTGIVSLYVNGVLVDSEDAGGNYLIQHNTKRTFIGAEANGNGTNNRFEGRIDEVSLWDVALTQSQLRDWMCKKVDTTHPEISGLLAYYRFDDASGSTLTDLVAGYDGTLTNMDASTDWVRSGAALGDESKYTYGGASIVDTMANGNEITLDDFSSADGIHLYRVNDTAVGSTYPGSIGNSADSAEYFGVFMVGDSASYDVTIDYSANTAINGQSNEQRVRGIKRSGGDDTDWEVATGELRTNTDSNTISILNQTGTEYVTGFENASYPVRPGSGYALDFDGSNERVDFGNPLDLQLINYTVECWLYTRDDERGILTKGQSRANNIHREFDLFGNGSDLIVVFSDLSGNNTLNLGSIPLNEWTHVAVTKQDSFAVAYLNGIAVDSITMNITPSISSFNWNTSYNSFSNVYALDGRIDELRFWNTPLSGYQIREWMTKKLNSMHDSIENLVSYYRFDEGLSTTVADLAGGNQGTLINSPTWMLSGAALGDESKFTYGGSTLIDTMANGNEITLDDFSGADGIHLYRVNDTAVGSTYPSSIGNSADSAEYFGVFMVGDSASYDVTIDYSANTFINGQANEQQVRGVKRSGGDDTDWEVATGELRTNTDSNTISILNQTGTEYVTGFANAAYPVRPGSGYALDFDGVDDQIIIPHNAELNLSDGDFAIESWIYLDSYLSTIISKGHGNGPSGDVFIFQVFSDGKLGLELARSPLGVFEWEYSNSTVPLNQWVHVAASFNLSTKTVTFYQNGIQDGVKTFSLAALYSGDTNVAYIGTQGYSCNCNEFEGKIDEVRVWNSQLPESLVRSWMTKKVNASHDSISNLLAYYRFDEDANTLLQDLVGGNDGVLTNMDASTDWVRSGAALGDESKFTYVGTSLVDTLTNGNEITIDDFTGADGIHLYTVTDTAEGSSYPSSIGNSADSGEYFGVFMVGDSASYDVTIDYSANTSINGQANEHQVRGIKRSGGDDDMWQIATGEFRTNIDSNTISILNQTGTEYVTGFVNSTYPARPGSGYALDFDGSDDQINVSGTGLSGFNTTDAFTVETWVRINSSASGYDFIYNSEDAGSAGLRILLNDGSPRFGVFGSNKFGSVIEASDTINDDQWHHLAYVYDGSQSIAGMSIFLDGVELSTSQAITNTISTGSLSDTAYVGRYHGSAEQLDGQIDELRVWNRALDSTEIRRGLALKLNANYPNISDLISYYRFDENTGTTLTDLVGGSVGVLTNMDASTDWVYSGAALGDSSNYIYGGTSVSVTHSDGDELTASSFAGSPVGVHVYAVEDTANYFNSITGIAEIDTTRYFGAFIVGGTSPTVDLTYDYSNNAILTSLNESRLTFISRDDQADTVWISESDSTTVDVSANTIVLTSVGNLELAAAKGPAQPASAINFDGVNDRVDGPTLNEFSNTTEITLEYWVNPETAGGFSHMVDVGNSLRAQYPGGSSQNLRLSVNGTQITSTNQIPNNEWTHIAITFDGTKASNERIKIYFDGIEQAYSGTPGTSLTSTFQVSVGAYNIGTLNFDGSIDEVRIWDYARSQSEIVADMGCQLIGNECGLRLYYNFSDSASIGEDNSSFTTVYDKSPNGNDGTYSNADFSGNSSNWIAQADSVSSDTCAIDSSSFMLVAFGNDTIDSNSAATIALGTDFGQTGSGFTSSRTFNIVNYGTDTINIDTVIVTGAGFTVGAYTAQIDTGDTGTLTLEFSPVSGSYSGTVSIDVGLCENYEFDVAGSTYISRAGSGFALNFDGIDDYVSIDTISNLPLGSNARTVETWYRTTDTSGNVAIVNFGDGSTNLQRFNVRVRSGDAVGIGMSGSNRFYTANVSDGNWHHIAVSMDSGAQLNEIAIYFDGVLMTDVAYTAGGQMVLPNTIQNTAYLGSNETQGVLMEGDIDEVRIWNVGLDSNTIRQWMCRKVDTNHPQIDEMIAYYRFDEATGTEITDLVGGNTGVFIDSPTWQRSGAALGDTSVNTYGVLSSLTTTLANGNVITLDDYAGADGIHLYRVSDTAVGSTYPSSIGNSADSAEYFGVFRVGGSSYDVTIDYSANTSINGQANEQRVRGVKRAGGDDNTWQMASGEFRTNTTANTISILNQTGTEYVTGFVTNDYPSRPGSGYALDFDGVDDQIYIGDVLPDYGSFTISTWFNPNTFSTSGTNQEGVFVRGLDGSGAGWSIALFVRSDSTLNGAIVPKVGAQVNTFNSLKLQAGDWHHAALSWDASSANLKLYIDGELQATSTAPNDTIRSSTLGSFIGRGNLVSEAFDGKVDEVAIWNDTLSQSEIRNWMVRKMDSTHPAFSSMVSYYRFDESSGDTLYDLVSGNDGPLANMTSADWVYSGAALGDESTYTYGVATSLADTLNNGNEILVDDFADADGIHLYTVNDTAIGSSFPSTLDSADSVQYFGVFMVGGSSYDVTIDYSANTAINGQANERQVRGIKRSGGDDSTWDLATGEFRTNLNSNTISVLNQSGTEYVTGFVNTAYPSRPGSGIALDFDGSDDQINVSGTGLSGFSTTDSITIETWVKINSSASGLDFIYNAEDAGSAGLRISLNDGSPRFGVFGSNKVGSVIEATDTINDNQWHHLAYVYDGSQALSGMSIYLDGVEIATTQIMTNAISSGSFSDTAYVGRYYLNALRFDGQFDELRVWNRALDSTEIRKGLALKLNANYQNISDLISYYRFDENTGTTLTDLVGGSVGVLTNMDPSTDWILSGASLGDTSVYDYTGNAVTLGYVDGDSIVITEYSGNPIGIQVYRVDEAPNDTIVPLAANFMDTTHYYGYFLAGGTNPKANIELSYANNAGYVATNNGDDLLFLGRDGNDDGGWNTKASALITNNTVTDSIKVFSQDGGTEIIVGRSGYLTPPGSGYSLEFDGTNDFVQIPHNNNFNVSAVTIETWVYWTGNGSTVDFISGKATNELEIHMGDGGSGADSSIRFIPTNNVYIDAPAGAVMPNKWNHIACVYDPANSYAEVYINGVTQTWTNNGGNPLNTAITTSATDYFLGIRSNGTFPFEGQLDEFRIWNDVLDSTVIRKWMSRKLDVTHDSISHLISYYRFDQIGDTSLIDLIGGNHGTLTNMDETTDWVTSGAAIGDMSVYTYDSTALAIELPNNDSVFLTNFDAGVQGVQLYYVAERSNFTDFYGVQSVDTSFYFGVHKAGDDTATYDVTMRYGNSSHLTGASAQYRVGLAKRDNNADNSWEADWFNGTTTTGTETIFLPNQTGTEYAGIVSANNALDFDGLDDRVEGPNASVCNFDADDDFTISAWVKMPVSQVSIPTSQNEIITKRTGSGGQYPFAVRINSSGRVLGARRDNASTISSVTSVTAINDNTWHHIAYTKVGQTLSMYIDGVLDNTDIDSSATSTLNTGLVRLGHRSAITQLTGSIDELRIYSRGLCEDEIQSQMSCELDSVSNDSLVLYYSFNQGVADSVNTGLDSLIDLSGNGNNGTLTNMALTGSSSNWTDGSTGITGSCEPYIGAEIYVLSEGDTIVNYDSIASTADSTNFGDVVFQTTTTVQYEVHNTGGDTLDIDTIYFTGSDSAFFSASYPSHIAPGVSSIITMQVTPTASDSIFAYLNLATNDCDNSPYRFQVKGNVLGYAGALNFDGVNDYVNISDTLGYVGLKEFTVEAWIRIDTSTGTLQAIMSATGTESFHFQTSSSGADNNVFYTNNGIVSLPIFPETPYDEWRHVAMVAKSGGSNVYINGSLYGTGNSAVFDSILVTNNIRIGSGFGASRFFDGDIDEVRLWNRALDSTEIQANMSCELEGTECGLLAYYNFNSDTARTFATNTGLDTLIDSSGNGHYGVLMNMALAGDSSNWIAQSDSILNNCIDNGDLVGPIVIPVETLTVYLDSMGIALIDSNQADSASCDYYSGIQEMAVSQDTVTCANNGDTLILSALDSAGLAGSAEFVIEVLDTFPPIIIPRNITVYLDTSGQTKIDVTDVDSATFDYCTLDSTWIVDSVFTCADTLGDTIWLYAIDDSGNKDSATAVITILDTVAPIAIAQNVTIALNASGIYVLSASQFDNSSTDNCAIDTLLIDQDTITCADTAGLTIQFTVIDRSGNSSTVSASLTVIDTIAPVLNTQLDTIYLDTNGIAYTNASAVDNGSTDNCGIDTMWLADTSYACSDTGLVSTVFFARDASGNTDSVAVTIFVADSILPSVIAQNVTVYLDNSGQATIDTNDVNNGTFDNCGIETLWLSESLFHCEDSVGDTIWLFALDFSGNIDSAFSIVTAEDTVSPAVLASSIQIYLDTNGSAAIAADSIDFGTTDNCAIDSLWLDQYTFDCSDSTGAIVTLFARDVSGNISSDTTVIYTIDTIPPVIFVTNDTIYLNTAGVATLDTGMVNNGTTDNCQVDSLWLSQTTFSCNDTVSSNPVTFFARDISGNIDSFGITIIVVDTVSPTMLAQNITIYLDTAGAVSIDTADLNNGSSDNCILDTMWLSAYDFTCVDTLDTIITLFGRDLSGNGSSANATVTILDSLRPQAMVANLTIYLDSNGSATIGADSVDNGTTDNCSVDSIWLSKTTFGCGDTIAPDTITFFVRDVSGNRDSAMAAITVLDTQPPVVVPRNLTVYLDVNGGVSFNANDIDSNSSDNCLIDSIWISTDTFACADSNGNNVTLYAKDVSGNVDSAVSVVTVLDTVLPTVVTQNRTVYLDGSGNLSIGPDTLDNGSFDNCTIDSTWLSASSFTCADSGDTVIFLIVRDISGNVDSSSAILTIEDTLPPTIWTNNVTVYLDSSGFANILPDTVDSASSDNCAIALTWISDSSFSCSDTSGGNTIWFFAKDVSGNVDSSTAMVTVLDTMPPLLLTNNLVVQLNNQGTVSVANDSADAGTTDNCQLDSVWMSQTTFECVDVGINNVIFYGVDITGNVDSTTITVTVQDTVSPVAIAQSLTLALDSFGGRTITALDIDSGSWDSCGIASYAIDVTSFDCSDVGSSTTVTLTITDVNGNSSIDQSTVTIQDDIAPEVITQNITVYLNDSGYITIVPSQIDNGTWDSCGVDSLQLSVDSFSCGDVGNNNVTLTAIDVNGNSNSASAIVTVLDSTFPVAIAYTDTIIIYLDSFGVATIAADTIDSGSFDNCAFTKAIDVSFYTCVDAGSSHPVVLTITDASGNVSIDTGYVFVDDTIPPVPDTYDTITVSLDSFGMVSIDTSDVLIAISDSCAIASIDIDSSDFTCTNTSAPIVVTTTIVDTNGNVGTDSTVVIVVDNILPVPIVHDTILYLDSVGIIVIDSNGLDNGSNDICGIQSITNERDTFYCTDLGAAFMIWVYVEDVNGNVDSVQSTVQVFDTISPVAHLFFDTTVHLNTGGTRPLTANRVDSASFDNCGLSSRARVPNILNCSHVGDTLMVGVILTDASGNSTTDSLIVYTVDTVLPAPELHNVTVYLDPTGNLVVHGDTMDSASSDGCGIDTIWLDKNTFNCGDVGANTVQVFIRDVNMNVDSTQTAILTVVDSLAPITYSIDSLTVYLSNAGIITIQPADIDSGSWDSCGIADRVLSDSVFTCADVGLFPTTTLFVTDVNGNIGTSITVVEVIDTVRPVAIPKDTNYFYLDANGQLTITGIDLDSVSYDSCGIVNYISDTTSFNCGNIGTPISAQMTLIDVNGNRDSANTVIIILDTVSPIAIAQNISVYLDTNGLVSITPQMVNNGSNDSCGIDTIYIDTANFSCANTTASVNVTLTVEDVNGNVSTAIAIVTVIDSVNPIVTAHDTVVYLDANGVFVLDTSDINDGSTDNCFIDTMTLSQDTFTCAEAGQTLAITLSAFDGSGNTQSAVANVTVLDTVRPEPITNDIDLYLDANGNAMITASMIDSASYDSCGVDSIWLDIYSFDCGDVGANTVEFFIRDVNLNLDSTLAIVTVIDTVSPTALALATFTVWLDNNGDASITRDSVNIGSYDSCGITDYFLNDSIFDCSDVGVFPAVTMTVLDVNGNSSTAQTVVTVLDTVSPSAQATNYTAYLNSGGTITIDSSNINNGSSDNCSIVTITLDTFHFDCSDVGEVNPVVMTVTDASGNMDTAHAFVTVLDTVAPVAIGQNITVYLDSTGNVSIDSSMVNNGSYDSCGIDSITLSDYAFDCGDVSAAQDIEMYVFDVNGNSDTVIVTVTVEDTVAPKVFTLDSLTIALDSFGNYTLEANEIDSGSWDSCGIDTLILDQSIFGCSDIGSPIVVTMTATDVNSNSTTGQTIVTVLDTIAPQVYSMSDTVYLDSSGLISITTLNVDSGSWDSCGIASYAIDTANFNCANTDTAVKVVLTVTDVHGNVSSDSSFVVIIDSIRPQIMCQSDTVIANDSGQCGAVVSYSVPAVSDNCTVDTVFQSGDTTYQSGDEFPVGVTAVQFTVIDVNGNQDSCVFNVTVLDTQSPLIICQSDTLICDSNFIFNLPVVVENCPNDSIEQIAGLSSGSFYPVGITTNTFVSTDASGNTDTCSFEVTRIDYPSVAVAGQDTALCEAEDINLYAVDPVIGVGSWTSIGTGIIADTLDANSAVSQLSIGENEFVWTVRNDVCIPNSDTVLVSIDEQPTPIDLPADTSLCEEPEFILVDESVGIGQAYWTWNGDATIIDSTSDTVLVSNLGIGTMQLFRTNENGVCIASIDTMLIHNNIVPTVNAGEDFGRFGGKKVTLSPIVIDGSTYSWTPADLFTDPNILEAEVAALQTTTLILTVTSDSGCVAFDSLVYSVNGIDSIPTGITPNGDGVNDVWNIAGLSTYKDAEIYIFDQSGREIYFSKGYDTPWDGRLNGQVLPRASYYWIIDLKDGINEPLKGIISIIR